MNIKDQGYLDAFGKNLKKERKIRNLTIEQLAQTANISYSQVSRIESARINPTICTVKAIAEALEIPTSKLIDLGVEKQKKNVYIDLSSK